MPPSPAGPEHVEDRVEDGPHRPPSGSARYGGRGQERGNGEPLGVGQGCRIGASLARKLRASGRGPHGAVSEASNTFENAGDLRRSPHPGATFTRYETGSELDFG